MTIEEILAGESKNVEFREPAGKEHQIYEVCGCLCKWNRSLLVEKLTCVSISIEDKTIQITPESTPRKQKWR